MGAPVFHTHQVVTASVWPMLYGSYQKVLHSNYVYPQMPVTHSLNSTE